jgi:hypothetical protein
MKERPRYQMINICVAADIALTREGATLLMRGDALMLTLMLSGR